ncbi:hypothetical protein, partial [Bacillus sp. FJAT-27231]|uniref:hypothetical protein n=1 Tax=Bacillus sp. FJAT-27231 TaxID=1679168 RepID=UPI0018CD9379
NEKQKQPFRLGRHKTDRRSGVLCHTDVTAYDRESGCWSWTTPHGVKAINHGTVLPVTETYYPVLKE